MLFYEVRSLLFQGNVFFSLQESPLQAIHLLWIKMILDSLAAVAFASERPMEKFGNCQSYSRHDSLFSRSVGKNVILHSLYQINVVLSIFFTGERLFLYVVYMSKSCFGQFRLWIESLFLAATGGGM